MIQSFADDQTRDLFRNGDDKKYKPPAGWVSFLKVAARKLDMLDAAKDLRDLKSPGNSLEKLSRDRIGQHSIRINDQWRVCFKWSASGPEDVEIVDYH